MDEQKNNERRVALVGLSLLAALSLAVFGILFFGAGDFLTHPNGPADTDHQVGNTDTDDADDLERARLIAEAREKMNNFRTKLDSPYLIVVSESSPLPEEYTVELASLTDKDGKNKLETVAASQMKLFLQAARSAGYKASVSVSYRDSAAQKKLFDSTVQDYMNGGYTLETARSLAAMKVGSVNCSEHQTGYAVDFASKEMSSVGNDGRTFEKYLTDSMAQYGFILSYPAGAEAQTGHDANTVHYRYVGVDAAAAMSENHWTLVQYRDYLNTQIDYLSQYIQSLESK